MSGIDPRVASHKLSIFREARLVAQKRRNMGGEKREVAKAEVQKLISAGLACPKDTYPFPSIDRLVDGAAGHRVFSFLDAYSGYNQIPMYPTDKEKTAFITKEANFYYEVMPFGLKNVGATY